MSAVASNGSSVPSKEAAARQLAEAHRDLDDGITRIHRLLAPAGREADPSEPIKLLEVNRHTPISGIVPVYFGPHPMRNVLYPSIIVEVHPSEWEELELGTLLLPNGWTVGEAL
jgi:hypothetical protein